MGNVALIPAAGFGTRFHETGPKALVRLGGRPFLVHALERLAASGLIDRAVVSCPVGLVDSFESALSGFSLPVTVVEGGSSRKDSVLNAFKGTKLSDDDLVCIHDAARPLVDPNEVAAVIQAAEKTGAAVACYSAVETMKQVANGRVVKTVPRNELVAASTPQVFRVSLFRAAIEKDSRHEVTDDAELVERMGVPVAVVLTSRWNIKITYPEDLSWAEAYLRYSGSTGEPS